LIFATATEAAIQNMVAAFESETDTFANDQRARPEMFTQDAKAADFSVWRKIADNSGDGGAMAEDIASVPRHSDDLQIFFYDGEIIGKGQPGELGMIGFDAGIQHSDPDVFSGALFEVGTGGFNCWPGIGGHALVQPTA